MFNTNVETLLKVGSLIKLNTEIDLVPSGEYVVHEMVVGFRGPGMERDANDTSYWLEDLRNDHRDDCLDESSLNSAMAAGVAEILDDKVLLYKVNYHDKFKDTDEVDYIYVKEGTEVSCEYFETRVEREHEIATPSDTEDGKFKLTPHEIEVRSFELV